jgi:hypothetical protein
VQLEQGNQFLCGLLVYQILIQISRSTVIDYLSDRFRQDENIEVLYVYFDYKTEPTQSVNYTCANLLKQMLSRFENIPFAIESLYNESIRRGTRPESASLIRLLLLFSERFSSIYVVLDALDECSDHHRMEILKLVYELSQKSAYKFLISGRPHFQVGDILSNVSTCEIRANRSDLEQYTRERLEREGNINELVARKCLELIHHAQGM